MASIGHALLGDPVYGRTKHAHKQVLDTLNFRRQALHAAHLGFVHPITGETLGFDSAMPPDMQELFSQLIV
jgi:23S rRNA pseudouridine1911/1915/1917 synthase